MGTVGKPKVQIDPMGRCSLNSCAEHHRYINGSIHIFAVIQSIFASMV